MPEPSAKLTTIPAQVRLPLAVAIGVVKQGIRIRLGRSLVTVTGVVLGVAFLASILTAQAFRRSVAEEDRLREAASRAYGYLVAETGSVFGRRVAVVLAGEPSPLEQRLLQRLERDGVSGFDVLAKSGALEPSLFERVKPRAVGTARELEGAAALLVLGAGALPSLDYDALTRALQKPVIAFGSERADVPALTPPLELTRLSRPLPPEEAARLVAAAERERVRGLWIIAISLLVTVIGISNAMLMSVTERFRDIGTMKCLGAESRFIRRLFLLEASLMGVVGGVVGVLLGNLFALASTLLSYGPRLVGHALAEQYTTVAGGALSALLAGAVLSVVAALYPAQFAARMLPAAALRSNV